jgi:hypothetical protein
MITIVSGMPRSGTSMVMQMLEAAGLEIHSDGERAADVDNPKGYFELEAARRLPGDVAFLARSYGKVVKIVAPLLKSLPPEHPYRVIFIERDIDEMMASQRVMMERGGRELDSEGAERVLARVLEKRIEEAKDWLDGSENIRVCYVTHADLIDAPMQASTRIANFLEQAGTTTPQSLSQARRHEIRSRMAEVVDAKLYRQQRRSQ